MAKIENVVTKTRLLIIMRLIFLFSFLLVSNLLFAQNTVLVKEINHLIEPEFQFDTSNGFINNFYDKQAGNEKKMIILAWKKESDDAYPTAKIFVFERLNGKLKIIDSSKRYIRDGMGPNWNILNDTLKVIHGFHGGFNALRYVFNKKLKKYLLVSVELKEVIHDKKYNNVPVGYKTKYYDINKKELLTIIQRVDDSKIKTKNTRVKKILPKGFIADLAHFIDPAAWFNNDSSSDIYDKIF